MDHLFVLPETPEKIIGILGITGGIRLSEIAASCCIRRWFADIVNPAPDKLSEAERMILVFYEDPLQAVGSPAGIAVAQGGALSVCIVHDALTSTGIINDILMRLGILKAPYAFLGDPKLFWGIVTLSHLWKETGWNAIIYLAAITSIDPCLYESASIDGAGRFQKMRYVTLPGLRPTIMILLLMNMGNVLNAGFELQYLLGNGLVQNVSRTIDIYILDWALDARNMDYSLGTAAGIFKTVVSMTFIVVSNYIAKKKGDERLF